MSIKQKVKGLWGKLRKKSKHVEAADDMTKSPTDNEISAEEVVEHEVFPPPKNAGNKSKAQSAFAASRTAPRVVRKRADDTEAAADPSRPAKRQCGKRLGGKPDCGGCGKGKRGGTRPTNPDYEMIDPDGGTCDTGKS